MTPLGDGGGLDEPPSFFLHTLTIITVKQNGIYGGEGRGIRVFNKFSHCNDDNNDDDDDGTPTRSPPHHSTPRSAAPVMSQHYYLYRPVIVTNSAPFLFFRLFSSLIGAITGSAGHGNACIFRAPL
uniref:Uncharacterized protein n=1 Tax=Loa loa TaxID=7209 RepID=A0A1I7VMR5_LOALO